MEQYNNNNNNNNNNNSGNTLFPARESIEPVRLG
jgi:hypothetical protein